VKDVATETKIEILFQDEMRLGQKNGQVRQWARRGTRPRQPAEQRYESTYIFGAICLGRVDVQHKRGRFAQFFLNVANFLAHTHCLQE